MSLFFLYLWRYYTKWPLLLIHAWLLNNLDNKQTNYIIALLKVIINHYSICPFTMWEIRGCKSDCLVEINTTANHQSIPWFISTIPSKISIKTSVTVIRNSDETRCDKHTLTILTAKLWLWLVHGESKVIQTYLLQLLGESAEGKSPQYEEEVVVVGFSTSG